MEGFLHLPVDGRQSAADCRAIRAYQHSHAIEPGVGRADGITYAVLYWQSTLHHPEALRGCPPDPGRAACVDLTHQIMWVRSGTRVVFGPVPIRSGRPTAPTRTGTFHVFWRDRDHYSNEYQSAMPFSQFFSGGQALHGILGDLYRPPGSHGCVNLWYADAKRLWSVLAGGDRVHVWGRRPPP